MDLEKNKLFAAVLVAGIAGYFFGFVSDVVFHEAHSENAYHIEVAENLSTGAIVAAEGPEPIAAFLATADASKGESLARACAACHSFDKGGADGIGPNLWNIVNRTIAGTGFAYSEAMAAKQGSWTFDELNGFLYKPKSYIEGTKMNYIGLKDSQKRADVIAYLRSLSDNPAALPDVPPAAEEAVEATEDQAAVNEEAPVPETVEE